MVAILVVRHRMVVRSDSIFHFPEWFYVGGLVGGWILGLAILLLIWSICNSTELEKYEYVRQFFPNCLKVFDLPGVLVITNVYGLYSLLGLIAMIGAAAEGMYIIASCIVLFELSKQTSRMSISTLNHHKKIVIDTAVQIVIKSIFLSTWAFWLVTSYFIASDVDTRVISIVMNSLFVFAPIPGTISMLIQNTTYRKFVLDKILLRRQSVVSPDMYVLH
ncbi:unnamed protein product [Caenorhabditis sp. 36 PRJEB53466]|nr:unnamed protein product [Caenorhabditis sp. 36 PRJEB53466]